MLYSHSRIGCFEDCPRCFRYRYIDKIPIEYFETVEQFMGSRVHESLEKLYKDVMSGGQPKRDELIGHYTDLWSAQMNDGVFVNSEDLVHLDYQLIGQQCLTGYFERHHPFDAAKVLACELRVEVDLRDDGNYRLIGYIDRVDRRDGTYEIHDYKTSSRLPGQASADRDRQLAIYEMGLRQKCPSASGFEYCWHYLRHGKELRSKRTEADLERHKKDIIKSIHRIEEAIVEDWFPAVRTPKCAWCEYQNVCPEKAATRQTKLQG
ncbi:MAG: PD-(D/E)XK nuclease family protein [Candidatus Altiarchaeota archaeon]